MKSVITSYHDSWEADITHAWTDDKRAAIKQQNNGCEMTGTLMLKSDLGQNLTKRRTQAYWHTTAGWLEKKMTKQQTLRHFFCLQLISQPQLHAALNQDNINFVKMTKPKGFSFKWHCENLQTFKHVLVLTMHLEKFNWTFNITHDCNRVCTAETLQNWRLKNIQCSFEAQHLTPR